MQLELLVEEESAEAALRVLLPKLLKHGVYYEIRLFQGKPDLLGKLPERLRGYARRVPREDLRILVLIDEDRQSCTALKASMEEMARDAGLVTKNAATADQPFRVVTRIAVEELEAWFFGDVPALVQAYPGVPATLGTRAKYRDPDQIAGGTAEALHDVLRAARYYTRTHMPTVEVAQRISSHMNPMANRSHSFCCFRDGLAALTE
ncbi:MAG TPA: DUF4276 family protein [Longimicrobium sp.]|nr:DUF4276 family protein [Longimicrobium sp.]